MPPRSRRAVSKPPLEASAEPSREALLAALAERDEAIAQQAATALVMRVINAAPGGDLAPVFEAILDACQRLFGTAEIGIYTIGDDDMVRVAAWRGPHADELRRDVTPLAESVTGRIIRERRTHHIADLGAAPNLSPILRERVERLGGASLLYAPMLWEDRGLGSISVSRSPPRPFSDREQALLQTFADQAVIAIENARLFDEVQARTRDLTEALQQQTATADVLKVISRSVLDLDSVLQTLIDTAVRLARGSRGTIFLQKGDALIASAFHSNVPDALREYLANAIWRLDGDTPRPRRPAKDGSCMYPTSRSSKTNPRGKSGNTRPTARGYGCP